MIQTQKFFKLYWMQILVFFLAVVFITVNIFRIGGDKFVFDLNSNINAPMALFVTVLALIQWRHIAVGNQNRLLWSGLTIGWVFWTIAESWWGIGSLIGQKVPYPSWADLFWILGYIPIYVALLTRIRSLPKQITSIQTTGLWLSALLSSGATILFVFIPVIQNNDPTAILESALNLLYPLMDIILLLLVLRILFSYQEGRYGRAWKWLSAGFVMISIADLLFSYGNANNIYYPNGNVTYFSTLGVDVPYSLSYFLWAIGIIFVQSIQQKPVQPFIELVTPLPLIPNTHLLIFTKDDNTVIDVSQNYYRLFPLEAVAGKTISTVLGLSPGDSTALLEESQTNTILKERAVMVNARLGQQQGWISGMPVFNTQGKYTGINLILRFYSDDPTLDDLLTKEQKGMIQWLLAKTGSKEKDDAEIKQSLTTYYLAYYQAFYNRIFAEGGSILVDSFLSELQSVADQHGWQINIKPANLLDVGELPLSKTKEILPILFEASKQFVIRTIDPETANTAVQDVRSCFDETTLKNIALYEKIA